MGFAPPVWAGVALLKDPGISPPLTHDSAGLALVLVAERGPLVDHMGAPLGSLRPLCAGVVVWRDQGFNQVLLTARHNHPLLRGHRGVERKRSTENTVSRLIVRNVPLENHESSHQWGAVRATEVFSDGQKILRKVTFSQKYNNKVIIHSRFPLLPLLYITIEFESNHISASLC